MFRIRLHGRGGQGIKTGSQILGSALFREGFEVQDAPRYGAERRGAPVFAYVRAARAPIYERGVIARPDLVAVADDTLIAMPAAGVLQGAGEATVLLVAGRETPEVWRERVKFPGTVLALPEAGAPGAGSGARCAGAAARLLGVVTRDSLAGALEDELAPLGAALVAENLRQALAAYDTLAPHAGRVREGAAPPAAGYAPPQWVELPLEDVALAAPDIRAPASSLAAPTGLWRSQRPVIDAQLCRGCVWVCSTYCPDSAIAADAEGRPVIDYDHCKGCMLCVAVCPPHAIRAEPERRAAEAAP